MQRRHAPRAAATVLLVAAVGLPTSAVAGILAHDDPAKDAQQITETDTGTTITGAPDNKTGDIVHLEARYGLKRLKEKVRLRAMAGHWFLTSRISTDNRHFDLVLQHDPGTNQVTLTRGKAHTAVVCDGLVPDVDRPHRTVAVTVPADCLFTPAWVKVGLGVVAGGKTKGVSYGDDALRRRGIAEAQLTLSSRIGQN